jgi:hypothetical protein
LFGNDCTEFACSAQAKCVFISELGVEFNRIQLPTRVLPALHKAGVVVSWLDIACLIAIGSTLAAVFLKRLGDAPLWPLRDPRLKKSIALKN